MGISIISDVHVKKRNDDGYTLLMNFLSHEKVEKADSIYLLGDIFDFMCGGHHEYLQDFAEFFSLLKELIFKKKTIYYIEGNHDFHLKFLFNKFLEDNSLDKELFKLTKKGFSQMLWGRKYYFAHGDEIELGNYSYHLFKTVMNSVPLGFIMNQVVSYPVLKFIGQNASTLSRKRGKKESPDYSYLRQSFRNGSVRLAENIHPYFIICGHSHIKDDFFYCNDDLTFRYLNNGFALETRTFIHIDNHQVDFIHL